MNATFHRLLLAACLATALPLAPAMAADAGPIKIGVLMPLKSVIGRQGKQGADLAAEMLNEQGGLPGGRKIELVTYDSNFSAVDGVSAARRLIDQDKVKFIAGEISSTPALAVLQIARATNTLFMVSVPKHPDITKSGYAQVFRLNTTLDADATYTNQYLDEKIKPSKVAFVAENSDYGRYTLDSSKKYFGNRFVAGETFELTQNDFTTLMSKVKASGADAVCVVAGKPEQAAAALRAMSQLGLQARRCLATGVLNEQSLALAGDAAEGAFGSDIYVATIANPLNEQFVKRFKARYGNTPEKIEELGFEAVWLVGKAMTAAGTATDPAKVAAALHGRAWPTPRGDVSFDQGGQAQAKRYVDFTVKGGKLLATE